MGATGAHAHHGFLTCHHDRVAPDDQVGCRHAHPGGSNGLLAGANQYMAPGGTAFLGQATGILGHDALAFQVGGHTQQLPDGDDAGATHTRHHNAPHT